MKCWEPLLGMNPRGPVCPIPCVTIGSPYGKMKPMVRKYVRSVELLPIGPLMMMMREKIIMASQCLVLLSILLAIYQQSGMTGLVLAALSFIAAMCFSLL